MKVHTKSDEKKQKKVTRRKRRTSKSYMLVDLSLLKIRNKKRGNRSENKADPPFTSKNWGTHYKGQVNKDDDPFLFKMVEALHIKYRDARTQDASGSDWMVCLHEVLKKKKKDQDSLSEFVIKLRGSVKGERQERELLCKLKMLEGRCIKKEKKGTLPVSADETFFHDVSRLLDLTYSRRSMKKIKRGFENGGCVQDKKLDEGTMMKTKFVYELLGSVKGEEPHADLLKRLELLKGRCVEKDSKRFELLRRFVEQETRMSSSVGLVSPVGKSTEICSEEQTPTLPNAFSSPLMPLPWSLSSSSVRPSPLLLSTTSSPDVLVNSDNNNNIQEMPEVCTPVKKSNQKKYTRAQMRRRNFF